MSPRCYDCRDLGAFANQRTLILCDRWEVIVVNQPMVQVSHLNFRYGAIKAVDDVSLIVPEGQAVALLGPNGAGKSTLLNLLLGLCAPDSGTVEIMGLSPADAVQRGLVGVMLQGTTLPAYTRVGELLQYLSRLYPSGLPPAEAIAQAQVGPLLGRDIERLSGGERRRVQFAAALLANPALLVLDEPTEGMDLQVRTRFWDTIRTSHRDRERTILFSTHDLSEADHFADQVVLLRRGRLVAVDTPAGLKSSLSRAIVRFKAGTAVDPQALARQLGGSRADPGGASHWSVSVADGDHALRVLAHTPGLSELEVVRGSLDDVFRALVTS